MVMTGRNTGSVTKAVNRICRVPVNRAPARTAGLQYFELVLWHKKKASQMERLRLNMLRLLYVFENDVKDQQ